MISLHFVCADLDVFSDKEIYCLWMDDPARNTHLSNPSRKRMSGAVESDTPDQRGPVGLGDNFIIEKNERIRVQRTTTVGRSASGRGDGKPGWCEEDKDDARCCWVAPLPWGQEKRRQACIKNQMLRKKSPSDVFLERRQWVLKRPVPVQRRKKGVGVWV